ncbi:MAG: hypothetical protein D6753_09365 [Planctomycetota bacterium]|nr:MAG: hypothetical protein D6753_09365 [Planctomycetota bacterium]
MLTSCLSELPSVATKATRRRFLAWAAGGSLAVVARALQAAGPETNTAEFRAHALGMLYGSAIGDALGGPIEFLESDAPTGLCAARRWPEQRRLTPEICQALASTIPLLEYASLRPEAAPYGPWREHAPPGTITDDTRHKIILLSAVQRAVQAERPLAVDDIARSFLDFHLADDLSADLATLVEEGLREYRLASRWVLGERNLALARPVERLWAGVDNCSGQMMFLPLAIPWAGSPDDTYAQVFALDFIDTPLAKDITAAIVAGIAASLSASGLQRSPPGRWELLLQVMRETDPYGFRDVPFAGRQLDRWMDTAERLAREAEGCPKRLYHLLETAGRPTYWWDAHFTLLVPLSMLHLTQFNPLAALHLTLDFGHDTDSYAQLLGAWIGAVHGVDLFPAEWRAAVDRGLERDFAQRIEKWLDLLVQLPAGQASDDR